MNELISIVCPVFNEAPNLKELCNRIATALKENPYEILLVENGSTDESLNVINEIRTENKNVKYVVLSRNFGHQGGLLAGVYFAKGHAVITMDADLQHPPELIPKMIEIWKSGFDVVYTTKVSKQKSDDMMKKLFYRFISLISEIKLSYGQSDFRLLDRKVVQTINSLSEHNIFLRGMVDWVGFKQKNIEYEVTERNAGESKFSLFAYLRFAMDGIFSFSTFPLRLFLWSGIILAFGSILYIIYSIVIACYHYFINDGIVFPKGWASLMICVLFLGGIQLIGIGILGEYLGRVFKQTKKRPNFIIKEERLD